MRVIGILGVVAFLVAGFLPQGAAAQDVGQPRPTALLADQITVTPEGTLIATGAVEIWVDDTRLLAQELRFDDDTDTLVITGPIRLEEGDDVTILASGAELSEDLAEGLLRDARLVLNQQLQLAATQLSRRGDRYSVAYKVAATSCYVCSDRPPIWEVRARSIILDDEEQQMYLNGAQLRIRGVPILWLPRWRLPQPGLDRATGFLTPSVETTSQLGTGIKVPYFIKLGDHRDLTLTPYVSGQTSTLNYRYRQAYVAGRLSVAGAFTQDEILSDGLRGYIDLAYNTRLWDSYSLLVALEAVSDETYFLDYDISSDDFIRADIDLTQFSLDRAVQVSFGHVNSLRDSDINAEIPTLAFEARYETRLAPDWLGGMATLSAELASTYRYSDEDPADVPAGQDGGRDTTRTTLSAKWDRTWITQGGFVFEGLAEVDLDGYFIAQDRAFDGTETFVSSYLGGSVSYPLVRTRGGATMTIEPKLQLVLAPNDVADVPNEDSTNVEFDEGNLFDTSRSPGTDRREQGSRVNAGLTWARNGSDGAQAEVTVGRIFRFEDPNGYSQASGAAGLSSDWLVSAGYQWPNGASFDTRVNIGDDLTVAKSSSRLDWRASRLNASIEHLYLIEDAAEDRPAATNELDISGGYILSDDYLVTGSWLYDADAQESREAELGLFYTNECVRVGFSVSRRFTSSTILEPTTDYALTVELLGFGGTPSGGTPRSRACQS